MRAAYIIDTEEAFHKPSDKTVQLSVFPNHSTHWRWIAFQTLARSDSKRAEMLELLNLLVLHCLYRTSTIKLPRLIMSTLPQIDSTDDTASKRLNTTSPRVATPVQYFLSTPARFDHDVCEQRYAGRGTVEEPYVVEYLPNDRQDALNFPKSRKRNIALFQSASFFAVTFSSSVYSSGIEQVMQHFHMSDELAILGLSLYVLGFALGPLLWAPMSEVYGRKLTFVTSYTVYIALSVAVPFAPNITGLLLLRFFASAFGSSAQTNPGGIIADLWTKEDRGPMMAIFTACAFLGPALGRW